MNTMLYRQVKIDPRTARYIMDYLYFARDVEPVWYYKKSKCSLFRGVIFSLCLNFTYANVVRFPRELERHGVVFLIPYFSILLLIGLPTVLLEISLGQFLGQGSASSWRASPIFKGASIVGRFASWLLTIWTSLQAAIALLYIGELVFKAVPFPNCASKVHLDATSGYIIEAQSGQECLQQTFLTPIWNQSLYFLLLTVSLVVIWTIAMICTYSSKTLRRSIFIIGLVSLVLLALQCGWNVADFINKNDTNVETVLDMFSFDLQILADSQIWFDALCQVIYSTGIGFGIWPVLTGKFLYKGDAVRSSMVYMCFNILVTLLSVTFFATQFNKTIPAMNSTMLLPELKPLTSIYDAALHESTADPLLARIIPGIAYLLIVLVSITDIAVSIYTASRFFSRHPNYIMSIIGLIVSIAALSVPAYLVSRVLDSQIVGVLVICALIFDILSITWIYGAKNIYTDLEFSIGRPILKSWVFIWCITPVVLIGLLFWWSSIFLSIDLMVISIPRWTPIILSLTIILLFACIEVYQQVDYNCCSMIQEAAQSSTDWGPADPIVRHAWKQWRSVCEDTGQKDFTLRRRGTRDYTHSIKKGQYSRNNNNNQQKYGTNNMRKTSSTGGSNSPNYSGSIFEDSAIEEDVSVGKYGGFQRQASSEGRRSTSNPPQPSPISINGQISRNKHQQPQMYGVDGYSTNEESRRISATSDVVDHGQNKQYFYVSSAPQQLKQHSPHNIDSNEYNQHSQHHNRQHNNVSKIDISSGHSINVPAAAATIASPHVQPKKSFSKNPLGRISAEPPSSYGSEAQDTFSQINTASNSNNKYGQINRKQVFRDSGGGGAGDLSSVVKNGGSLTTSNNLSPDHICWRKFSVNSEEFSTEL